MALQVSSCHAATGIGVLVTSVWTYLPSSETGQLGHAEKTHIFGLYMSTLCREYRCDLMGASVQDLAPGDLHNQDT